MGALTPLFLVAAVSLGIPLWLHLLHRHQARRISFPAVRYLERTERDHARRIRLRQFVLMLLRMSVLLLIVGAGARFFVTGVGSGHPPTAVVIVLDNSMSSGLVVGEERVFDRLKSMALRTVAAAAPEDRIWLLRAGEPWIPAVPGGPLEAREALEATRVSAAAGDLESALKRAEELLLTSPLAAREIHLLSDLQASAFDHDGAYVPPRVPVVAWSDVDRAPGNRNIGEVVIGGGLPPLEGQRSELTVRAGPSPDGDTSRIRVRIVVDGRIRGAADVPPGLSATIPLPAVGSGWIRGWAESDPDPLRADDRFAFAFRARPAPSVRVGGSTSLFLSQALGVLADAGRIRWAGAGAADLLVAMAGDGIGSMGAGTSAVIVPPDDPVLLPSLNRRLMDAGIPWRYEAMSPAGEAPLAGETLPAGLADTRVRRWYRLRLDGEPTGAPRTLARIGAEPWMVEGGTPAGGRYLLLASSLEPGASTLPLSTGIVRFLAWTASQWAGDGTGRVSRTAGEPLTAPRTATHIRFPSDSVARIDGTRTVRSTGNEGFYTFLDGDSAVAVEAVNPPESESRLERLAGGELETVLGADAVLVTASERWERSIFRTRQGPEMWWPLLIGALALLALESLMAASRGAVRRGARVA